MQPVNAQAGPVESMPAAKKAAAHIRLLGLDVDGTLTDGGLYISEAGEVMKRFSVHDGQGLRLLQDHGIAVAFITARKSPIAVARAAELGVAHVVQGCKHKLPAMDAIRQQLGLTWAQCAFFGDDWPDYPVLQQVGLPCTTPQSPPPMVQAALWLNQRPPGGGAVRELCDFILQHQSQYQNPWLHPSALPSEAPSGTPSGTP